MNVKKCLVLFLTICLCFSVLTVSVFAHDDTAAEENLVLGLEVGEFVSLAIAVALLIVAAVLCIVKRKKLAEALRAYKSEMKKITWFPWKSVWRSTVLVLVVVIAVAVLVGLLDLAFFEGQYALVGIGK